MNTASSNLESVLTAIRYLPELQGKQDKEMTETVKRNLIKLGKDRGYTVCAAGFPDECEKEWLFDMAWVRNEKIDGLWLLHEVALVLESEWSRALFEINYDFEKLLAARSPIKVMICHHSPGLFEFFEKAVRRFQHGAGEIYVLALYEDGRGFSVRTVNA